jgi:hypothetical protein
MKARNEIFVLVKKKLKYTSDNTERRKEKEKYWLIEHR